jgi:biotin synthase
MLSAPATISAFADKVIAGGSLAREEALSFTGSDPLEVFFHANRIRMKFRGRRADLCAIVSAKTGACPENCSYCAQSSSSKTDIQTVPLVDSAYVVERAKKARESGAGRFCIVTSGKRVSGKELERIAEMIRAVRSEGLLPCATLGLLSAEDLSMLRDAGLHRYHHNLETSRRFFPEICSTHTYDQKLETILAAKNAGLSICSGGIFGLGEEWEDRVDMALELRGLGIDSVPINFLVPVKGTPLGETEPLKPFEALKIVSLFRFMLPDKEIRICGGRLQTLGEFNSMVFMAGADGLLTGDCLTVAGRDPGDDLRLVDEYGMTTLLEE